MTSIQDDTAMQWQSWFLVTYSKRVSWNLGFYHSDTMVDIGRGSEICFFFVHNQKYSTISFPFVNLVSNFRRLEEFNAEYESLVEIFPCIFHSSASRFHQNFVSGLFISPSRNHHERKLPAINISIALPHQNNMHATKSEESEKNEDVPQRIKSRSDEWIETCNPPRTTLRLQFLI